MSPSTLKFEGERIVPQADNCEPNFAARMYQEHIARYQFAAPVCQGKSVIDVGCGVGYGSQHLALAGAKSVYAFDLHPGAVQHAKEFYHHENVTFNVDNAEEFGVQELYDVAICFELIEHVNKPKQVMRRILKALKPDGVLIMSTPRAKEEKRTHYHTHEYSYSEFEDLISEFFPNFTMYAENNHFASIVTSGRQADLNSVEYVQGQLPVSASDVFMAVAARSAAVDVSSLPSVAAISDDAYIVRLETDVAILHKAEDDLRAKFEYFTSEHSQEREGWSLRQSQLEAAVGGLQVELDESRRQCDELRAAAEALERARAAADTQVEQVRGDAAAVTEQARGDAAAAIEQAHARYEEELGREKSRLDLVVSQYEARIEEFQAELRESHSRHLETEQALAEQLAVARLEVDALMAATQELEVEAEATFEAPAPQAPPQDSIAEMPAQALLLELEAKFQQREAALLAENAALSVRAADADARRAEAYDYARTVSAETRSWRSRYEGLRSDVYSAVHRLPGEHGRRTVADHRHAGIVQAVSEQFPGLEATRHLVRDEVVDQIEHLHDQLEGLRGEVLRLSVVRDQTHDGAPQIQNGGPPSLLKLWWRGSRP